MGLASKLAASQQNQPPKQIIQQPQGSQNHSFQAGYSNETSYQGSVPPADHGYPSSQRGNSQYAPSSSNHRYQGSSPASQSAYQPSQGPPHSQMNPQAIFLKKFQSLVIVFLSKFRHLAILQISNLLMNNIPSNNTKMLQGTISRGPKKPNPRLLQAFKACCPRKSTGSILRGPRP